MEMQVVVLNGSLTDARAFDSYNSKKRLKNIGNTGKIQSSFFGRNIVISSNV